MQGGDRPISFLSCCCSISPFDAACLFGPDQPSTDATQPFFRLFTRSSILLSLLEHNSSIHVCAIYLVETHDGSGRLAMSWFRFYP